MAIQKTLKETDHLELLHPDWNELPAHLCSLDSMSIFKKHLCLRIYSSLILVVMLFLLEDNYNLCLYKVPFLYLLCFPVCFTVKRFVTLSLQKALHK